jgi:hypothetical protein
MEAQFGIRYNENHLSEIVAREIPEKIAAVATKHRMLLETPQDQLKVCYTCGRALPRNKLFFARNASRKDGFSSNCKECERLKRIERGGSINDRRSKDKKMP